MGDPTTLSPVEQAEQVTAFVLTPVCVRCGHAGFSRREDGTFRCERCVRIVRVIEFAPRIFTRKPYDLPRARGSR